MVGCGSLHDEYIARDRQTYEAMQPCIDAGIGAVGSQTLLGKSWRLLNGSWDGRVTAAEEKLEAAEERASAAAITERSE